MSNRHPHSPEEDKARAERAAKRLGLTSYQRRTFPEGVKLTYLRVMLTPEEKSRIRMMAAAHGFPSMSDYVRALLSADTMLMYRERESIRRKKAPKIAHKSVVGGSSPTAPESPETPDGGAPGQPPTKS